MTNKEERNSEMCGGKLNCGGHVNRDSCPNYSTKCKRKRKRIHKVQIDNGSLTNIESLPDDLVFDILLLLSAKEIYNGPMFVCRKWYDMVQTRKFISAHLQRSTPGLIIQNVNARKKPVFVEMRQGQIYSSKFNYKSRGEVWASCNGLVLMSNFNNSGALYITNPATKQHFALPPVSCKEGIECYSNMAYAEVSKQYKVVLMYCRSFNPSILLKSAILTVGVDKSWRKLSIKGSYSPATSATDGFIHFHPRKGTHFLTLNVETEIFTETEIITETLLNDSVGKRLDRYYSSMGKSLTMFIACSEFSWEILKMKSETGEWAKVAKIDLEARVFEFEHLVPKSPINYDDPRLRPVGWLNYPDVLVLCVYSSGVCILYNVRTQEIDHFNLDHAYGFQSFVVHRDSLEWLRGC